MRHLQEKRSATMLTYKVWTLLLALHIASSFAVVTAEINDDASVINDPMEVRHLQVTLEPLWFQRISASFVGANLKRCSKRSTVPENGAKCSSRKHKTCFFGNQACDGVGPHPETKCVCSSKTWKCEAETCPPLPVVTDGPSNGCNADGKADLSSNDPLCPVTGPMGGNPGGCMPALYGKTCKFGSEKW